MRSSNYRVIVQFRDVSPKEDNEEELQAIASSSAMRTASHYLLQPAEGYLPLNINVEILSNCMLRVTNNENRDHPRVNVMKFHSVGNSTDIHIKSEFVSTVDHLFVQQKNFSLLRFNAARECQTSFLCNLLVTEVDKRVQLLHAKILNISLEYFELRKYDVVNMLSQAGSVGGRGNKVAPVDRIYFATTVDLFKWLQGKYQSLWGNGCCHESLDITFQFTDIQRANHTVKLSLLLMYMNKMDSETKTLIYGFMQNLNGEKVKVKQTMLGDYLREYFNGEEKCRTLLMFDVPVAYGCGQIIKDMLRLACKSYDGVMSLMSSVQDDLSLSLNSDVFFDSTLTPTKGQADSNVASNDFMGKKSDSLRASQATGLGVGIKHGHKDQIGLKYWYGRIDESYADAVAALEAFYMHKYKDKVDKMCTNIKRMTNPMSTKETTKSSVDDNNKSSTAIQSSLTLNADAELLQKFYTSYQLAMSHVHQLLKEVATTRYVEALRTYIKVRNTDLAQHALQFKVRLLESGQQQLNNIILEEMCNLNQKTTNQSIKYPTRKIPKVLR